MRPFVFSLLLALLVLEGVWSDGVKIIVEEPRGAIRVGADVTLQCLAPGIDLELCKFQKYHKWMRMWLDFDTTTSFRCWFYNFNVTRESGELLLQVKNVYRGHAGPYRCVCNGSQSHIRSNALTIPLMYLDDVTILEPGTHFHQYMRSPRVVRVMRGKSVELACSATASHTPTYQWKKEGSDWIYPNATLRIEEISSEDAGTYTCTATHPSNPILAHSRSVQVQVETEPLGSLQLGELNLLLAVIVPAVAMMFVVVAVVTCVRRARRGKWRKMQQLDDEVVKTPIWKGVSIHSPTTISDSVPLVM